MPRSIKYLFLVLVVIWAALYYSQLAQYEGIVYSKNAPINGVEIRRDEDGIVYIHAQSLNDATYALGYAHAQDRLFQLHLNRRTPQGRLSELFGNQTLTTDIALRHYGLHRSARQMEETLSSEVRTLL